MAFTLRQETASGFTTKGSALSYAEGDNNFIGLYERDDERLALTGGTLTGSINVTGGQILSGGTDIATLWGGGGGETYDLNATQDGGNVDLNLTSTSGSDNSVVQLTAGSNITLTRNSATEVTIDAAGGGGASVLNDLTDVECAGTAANYNFFKNGTTADGVPVHGSLSTALRNIALGA